MSCPRPPLRSPRVQTISPSSTTLWRRTRRRQRKTSVPTHYFQNSKPAILPMPSLRSYESRSTSLIVLVVLIAGSLTGSIRQSTCYTRSPKLLVPVLVWSESEGSRFTHSNSDIYLCTGIPSRGSDLHWDRRSPLSEYLLDSVSSNTLTIHSLRPSRRFQTARTYSLTSLSG